MVPVGGACSNGEERDSDEERRRGSHGATGLREPNGTGRERQALSTSLILSCVSLQRQRIDETSINSEPFRTVQCSKPRISPSQRSDVKETDQ